MKISFLIFTLLVSSCALFEDFRQADINWFGDPNHPSYKKNKKPEAEVVDAPEEPSTPEVAQISFIEAPSKNWSYKKSKDMISGMFNYEAHTKDLHQKAEIIIVKNSSETVFVLELVNGKLSYKEGHSVEVKIDDKTSIQRVEATRNDEANVMRLDDAKTFISMLKDKKILKVELLVDGSNKEIYEFDISGLQNFFY